MRIYKSVIAYACFLVVALSAQSNVWTKVSGNGYFGNWERPAMIYSKNTDEYVLLFGVMKNNTSPYCVQVYQHSLGGWINALPSPTLYGSAAIDNVTDISLGKWADSTGALYNTGSDAVWGWGWSFKTINGYLRPNVYSSARTDAYTQFCLNTDDGKIYFYINNATFTYDPQTRLWDTLVSGAGPNGTIGPNKGLGFDAKNVRAFNLKWASLCYDAHNKEILLLGGLGLDKPEGTAGFWIFNPATKSWSKSSLSVVPSARAHSPMVYDPINKVVVLFGGERLDSKLNDTWVYDCVSKSWSKKNPAIRPAARGGHAMLYLPKSEKIVMMGGYRVQTNQMNEFELWTYDVPSNTWGLIKRYGSTEEWPKILSARPAFGGIVTVDKGDTILALADTLFDSYYFKPVTMRMACNPNVIDIQGTQTYGVVNDSIVYSTGINTPSYYMAGYGAPDTAKNEADLRAIPLKTWKHIVPPVLPEGNRAWGASVMAPGKDVIVYRSGGHAAYCNNDLPQYFISENRWKCGYVKENPLDFYGLDIGPGPLSFNNRPFYQVHPCRAMEYDVKTGFFITIEEPHTFFYSPDSMDWSLNRTTLPDANYSSPYATYSTGMCITSHGTFCLFGNRCYLFDSDSLKWRALNQTGDALVGMNADGGGVVYDSKRDRIIYARQQSIYSLPPAQATLLYEYSFATGRVTRLQPEDSSLTQANVFSLYRDAVYLPGQDIVLYYVNNGSSMLAYDCGANRWKWVSMPDFPKGFGPYDIGLSYDAKRNLIWFVGQYGCCETRIYVYRPEESSVAEEFEQNSAGVDQLINVSPNPFNPVSNIRVSLSKSMLIKLAVYNTSGKLIRTIYSGTGAIGNNQFMWDGANSNGTPVASGLYFIRLVAGGKILNKSVVLTR